MDEHTTIVTTQPTFLEELQSKLEAIKPDMFRPPDRPPAKGDQVVGKASEYLKKLHTLNQNITEEAKTVVNEFDPLTKDIRQHLSHGFIYRIYDGLFGDKAAFERKVKRIKELDLTIKELKRQKRVIDALFWVEARRLYPELNENGVQISIDRDWNLSWTDQDEDSSLKRFMEMAVRDGFAVG